MTWLFWVSLVEKVGLPLAEKLWTLAASGGVPTPEQWAELRALQAQTAESQARAALARAGVDLNDPKARALLELTKPF